MSRRYGRNQERAHRERIAELERWVQTLTLRERAEAEQRRKLEAALTAQRRELERLVEEIRAVSRNSALLPANEMTLRGEGPWRLAIPEKHLFVHHVALSDSLAQPMMIATVDVHEVRACLLQNISAFQKIVHVKLPGWPVRYAISRAAIEEMARWGLERVAEDIFHCIMDALREELSGSNPVRQTKPKPDEKAG